jgi:hypothetical protein
MLPGYVADVAAPTVLEPECEELEPEPEPKEEPELELKEPKEEPGLP